MLWNGDIGIFDFQSVGPANNWFPARYTFEVPEKVEDLFVFANIKNPQTGEPTGGVKPYASQSDYAAVIASSCKYPEKAVEIINYMQFNKEGQELIYLGIEDVMFKWTDEANGKYERLGEYKDDLVHRSAGAYVYGMGWTPVNAESRTMNSLTQSSQKAEMAIATDHVYIGSALQSWDEHGPTLRSLEMEMLCNLIVSTGDIQGEYEEYLMRWDEEGGLEFEKEASDYMKAQ